MTVFSTFSNNDDKTKEEVNSKLRNKIEHLLGDYQDVLSKNVEKASIKFIINRQGEIIVLSVNTSKDNLASFIKSKLNYKVASIKNVKFLKTYTLPVKFVKE
ncbi:hypothetical protein BW723_06815 [Polaribacter reichenbachii]|uniref:TonB C-terminal domain-containing protein n=2 Tax=Polaribacter reichenbachii TaxID=996801 RepID=A0A1B8U5W8_9FLAO|nr:hypothetical protein BW723_06815 [Polaribacter reichenbachii]AUC19884.1 hypothetical protein BTO17_14835 [Polaribacter reichenbachii]OBY67261.1 hypothetical protein LPB301_02675 [Polaribacter reichenbachii]